VSKTIENGIEFAVNAFPNLVQFRATAVEITPIRQLISFPLHA
jgi:hypothetical protein